MLFLFSHFSVYSHPSATYYFKKYILCTILNHSIVFFPWSVKIFRAPNEGRFRNTVLASVEPLLIKAQLICMTFPVSIKGKTWYQKRPSSHFSHIGILWFQIIVEWGGRDAKICLTTVALLSPISHLSNNIYNVPKLSSSKSYLDLYYVRFRIQNGDVVTVTDANMLICFSESKNTITLLTVSWPGMRLGAVWPSGYVAGILHHVKELNLKFWGKNFKAPW